MIGSRIRIAREACRITQKELSDLSGVPMGTVSSIESGRIYDPSAEHVSRIASATAFPTSFFKLGPLPDVPQGYYRKLKKGKAKDTKQMLAQVRLITEIVQRADQHQAIRLPAVSFEPVSRTVDLDQIEELAGEVRGYIGVGPEDPIPNVIRAAERAGIVVVRLPNEIPNHDAYSVWPDFGLGGRPIIAISAGCSADRERASVAHEISHLFLHTIRSRLEHARAEAEAWRLGSAVLFPQSGAESILRPPITLLVLIAAKQTYGVSVGLAAQRAMDLGLITKRHFVSLRKQMSARGWNRDEPVELPREGTELIGRIVDGLAAPGSIRTRAARIHTNFFLLPALSSSIALVWCVIGGFV